MSDSVPMDTSSNSPNTTSSHLHLTEEERQIYDRQLRVWGVEAQKRMRDSSVLLVGMRGLSCEVAKNIVLAGIGSLEILDDSIVQAQDLAANFLVTADDIGKNRAESCLSALRQLNPNVTITANTSSISSILSSNPGYFTKFRAVCVIGQSIDVAVAINNVLRSAASSNSVSPSAATQPPAFFAGECLGLYAYFFEDLQTHPYTHTKTRKDPVSGVEEEVITQETKNYATSLEQLFGDALKFSHLQKAFGKKKQEKTALNLWLTMRTVLQWRQKQSSGAPSTSVYPPLDSTSTPALYQQRNILARQIDMAGSQISQESLLRLAKMGGAELAHVSAVVGGILGQEILKVLSGKDEPLSNTFIYSAEDGYGLIKEL